VILEHGHWEGEPFVSDGVSRPTVGLIDDFSLNGDLGGDITNETVVFLWDNSGGSGTITHVAVLGRHGDKVVNLGSASVGDRVQLRAGRISDGKIELDVVQQGPDDAACCPGQTATRVWTLAPDGLQEGPVQATGTLSLADLTGVEWVLAEFGRNVPAPTEPEITLTFDGSRLTGKNACNRYFADARSGDAPGALVISGIGGTRMACPDEVMSLENRFLGALGNTTGYGFQSGKLALTWLQDNAVQTLLFSSRTPQE
jgi:heat shock protein HslJ